MAKKVSSKKLAMNRRKFMAYFSSIGLGATLLPGTLVAVAQDTDEITVDMVIAAEKIAGLSFPKDMRERFVRDLNRLRTNYQNIRAMKLDASVAPCFVFNPVPPGFEEIEPERNPAITSSVSVTMPNTEEELAFLSVTYLSALIKTRQVTSTDLTKIYLSRLKQYDPKLKCVITLTEKLALEQASKADEEISAGDYKGPLHGIPWGVKDLIAVKGYRTTWGAEPYKNQVIDTDATVYKRLTNAGAVLVAKLTSGGLATGDTWFGGKTRNPWNTEQGSGGSSAGPGSATAAGLVGFSIGTETQGSIISPSSRCGVTGLRPTFGMVSRHGVMPLSWTMDKVGPICRSAEDCAIVLNAIYGPDGYDTAVVNRPFNWHPADDLTKIRVGYVKSSFERESRAQTDEGRRRAGEQRQIDNSAIEVFRSLGIELIPLEFPQSISAGNLGFVLHIEGAAVFDDIVRSGEIDSMSNSNRPYRFRVRRFTPGVEYIQANRVRTILMQDFSKALKDIDVYIGGSTSITNHTGHPAMTIPHGFINGLPTGLRINGNLFKDAEMITVARAFQNATDHHTKHPAL
ncbi:amidase [candidate division KSB1 bacterium]|nr:amidase [candidate division KSB1 bacterium]